MGRRRSLILGAVLLGIGAMILLPVIGSFVPAMWGRVTSDWQRRRIAGPPRRLPIRAADYERFPRASFGFVLTDSVGISSVCFDTFRHVAEWRRPEGECDTTIDFRFSDTELDSIHQAMIAYRLFEFVEPHPPAGGAGMSPRFAHGLTVRAGDTQRNLRWSTDDQPDPIDDWKRLFRVAQLIRRIASSHPEVQAVVTHLRSECKSFAPL